MTEPLGTLISDLITRDERALLPEWVSQQLAAVTLRRDRVKDEELREQSRRFLALLAETLRKASGSQDVVHPAWAELRQWLAELSETRARQGFSASETATFVFSLKPPLFDRLRHELGADPDRLASEILGVSLLLDRLGLYATECYQRGREQVIARQQEEMMELSTPVVELWHGILALPLIGTLDSAGIAIIDITGVPTVDTLVAQHLLKCRRGTSRRRESSPGHRVSGIARLLRPRSARRAHGGPTAGHRARRGPARRGFMELSHGAEAPRRHARHARADGDERRGRAEGDHARRRRSAAGSARGTARCGVPRLDDARCRRL